MTLPALRTVTLHREGLLKVRVTGNKHCGHPSAVVDGQVAVRYTVKATMAPDSLDSNGFLIDQEEIHTYLIALAQDPVGWPESCERLVTAWGHMLLSYMAERNIRSTIHSMDFTLSPAPHLGSFTATFERY